MNTLTSGALSYPENLNASLSRDEGVEEKKCYLKRQILKARVGFCPCCRRENINIDRTIAQKGIAVAICAYSPIECQLKQEWVGNEFASKGFAVCSNCEKFSKQAVNVAIEQFKGEVEWLSAKVTKFNAIELKSPIYCGNEGTMVCLIIYNCCLIFKFVY